MVYGRCSVFGCGTIGGKQHRFPRNQRALIWKKFCMNPRMDGLSFEKFHDKFHVCVKHFDERCFTYPSSGRLLRNALPTLFPPAGYVPNSPSEPDPIVLEQWTSTSSLPESVSCSPYSNLSIVCEENSDSEQFFEDLPSLYITPPTSRKEWCVSNKGYHMIDELPELYMSITLPYLEKQPLYLKWVYDIIRGEAGQERVVYEVPCKDDKDGFMMIRDSNWDGEDMETLHVVALPYRPGILTIRDLRDTHLTLLRNIYNMGMQAIEEKYGVCGSQLRIFLQYLPYFYHLNVHFTMINDETCGTHVGKAHLLHSVINNLELWPNYYQVTNLQFYLEESHKLFEKFKEHGLVGRLGRFNSTQSTS